MIYEGSLLTIIVLSHLYPFSYYMKNNLFPSTIYMVSENPLLQKLIALYQLLSPLTFTILCSELN
jgi:hypothetical protein